jgi:hypothetical protein
MPTMYELSVPIFAQYLTALSANLDKAAALCVAKKIEPAVLTSARLAPDMFPLSRQVQIACDFAKGASARLAGVEVPTWEDNEKSIDDLKARIKKTIDFIQALKPAQFEAAATRDINIKLRGNPVTFKGQPYLTHFAMGHFYFHCTTAYNILRHNGVEIGKGDFIGAIPGM